MGKNSFSHTKKISVFALFTAVAILLQLFGSGIKIGIVNLNFVLIPLILCGMILGTFYASLLGFLIGVVILVCGITGLDPFTNVLFAQQPVVIILVCVVKTTLAGAVSSVVYKSLKKYNKGVASILSSLVCPIINTGIFVLGMLIIKGTLISAGYIDGGTNAFIAIAIGLVGVNFIFEIIVNVVLGSVLNRVLYAIGIRD